jgi:hypothetical protein
MIKAVYSLLEITSKGALGAFVLIGAVILLVGALSSKD